MQSTLLLPAPQGSLQVAATTADHPPVRLSLVVPTYNERKNIATLCARLTELLEQPLGGSYEIIVVDDDSPDRTWEAAHELTKNYPRVRVMRRQDERGLATAVVRGWQSARGDVLAVIDADLQHPPEVTLKLWEQMEGGADLAVASRHVEGGGVSNWSLVRRVLSRGAQLLGLILLPSVVGRVTDPMSGYFMVRRSSLANRALNPLGYKILIEVLGRARVHAIGEVGYVFRERSEGESKVTWTVYLDYLRHLLRLRFASLPLARFLRFAAVGMSGVCVDMSMLFVLSDPQMLAWGLTQSKLLAAELAIVNNFLWNDAWTFRDLVSRQGGARAKLRRLLKFNAICAIGLALNVVLLNAMCNFLGMNRYLANAIAIACVTAWNFLLNLKLSWRGTAPEQAATAEQMPLKHGATT